MILLINIVSKKLDSLYLGILTNTDGLFVNDGYLYNAKGEKVIEKDNNKGGSITVTSMIDITDETTGKAVPFYRVADQYLDIGQKRSNECYIKVSDTKIILGGNNLKVNN